MNQMTPQNLVHVPPHNMLCLSTDMWTGMTKVMSDFRDVFRNVYKIIKN